MGDESLSHTGKKQVAGGRKHGLKVEECCTAQIGSTLMSTRLHSVDGPLLIHRVHVLHPVIQILGNLSDLV